MGMTGVQEVAVFPDRLELTCLGARTAIEFARIAEWPRPRWFWQTLFHIGIRPRWLPVADRDWFHLPADRFFRFYTNPPLTICMPVDESSGDYASTYFVRIRMMLEAGGFHTYDLG
jgi:hypothetical protein